MGGYYMQMSKVLACSVNECCYNRDKECHALAINVGDANHPACDTFMNANKKGGSGDGMAGIGACRVAECKYNKSFECSSPGITVGHHQNHADCKTFVPA